MSFEVKMFIVNQFCQLVCDASRAEMNLQLLWGLKCCLNHDVIGRTPKYFLVLPFQMVF